MKSSSSSSPLVYVCGVVTLVAVAVGVTIVTLLPSVDDGDGDRNVNPSYGRCTWPSPLSSHLFDVSSYGIRGDGATDVTSAIQSVIDDAGETGATIYVPAGVYMIDALVSLNLNSNSTFKMAPNAILRAIPNSEDFYSIINLINVDKVIIIGGILEGERDLHTGTTGEYGHGLSMYHATNVHVIGTHARNFWGDGFIVGINSENITACGVKSQRSRRNGMSILQVKHMLVMDSEFYGSEGTPPESGLDIEPDTNENATDIHITNCTFHDNKAWGLMQWDNGVNSHVNGMLWDYNTAYNNGGHGMYCRNNCDYVITHNTIYENGAIGIFLENTVNADVSFNVVIDNSQEGIWCTPLPCANSIHNNTLHGNLDGVI